MTADRRNGLVVVALVLSLTVGVGFLLLLEPGDHQVERAPLLVAEQGGTKQVGTIEILYVGSLADAGALVASSGDDGVWVVYPTGVAEWYAGGPHVRVIVVGTPDQARLPEEQQRALLGALRELTRRSGAGDLRVRLVVPSEVASDSVWPPAAQELRELLVRKRLLAD
jgi:hypothetical protein